jgi:hypothetical protein
VDAALFVEELGEALEHDAAQLLGVNDCHGAAVIAGHVVADADRGQCRPAWREGGLAIITIELRSIRVRASSP